MNKDEILAKSRNENADEGMTAAENRGRRIGITAFALVEVSILIFNWFTSQPNYVPLALFWAFAAAEAYPKYKFSGKRAYLITVVCGAMAGAASLASYILTILR